MPETLTSGNHPGLSFLLLFGGNISSFCRGSIFFFFSYKFFNKDTFLSEIPIMSCFLSARPWEFYCNGGVQTCWVLCPTLILSNPEILLPVDQRVWEAWEPRRLLQSHY